MLLFLTLAKEYIPGVMEQLRFKLGKDFFTGIHKKKYIQDQIFIQKLVFTSLNLSSILQIPLPVIRGRASSLSDRELICSDFQQRIIAVEAVPLCNKRNRFRERRCQELTTVTLCTGSRAHDKYHSPL